MRFSLIAVVTLACATTACSDGQEALSQDDADAQKIFASERTANVSDALTGIWEAGSRYAEIRMKLEPHAITFAFRCRNWSDTGGPSLAQGMKVAAEVTRDSIRILESKERRPPERTERCGAAFMRAEPRQFRACPPEPHDTRCFTLEDRALHNIGISDLLESSDGRDGYGFEKLSD